MTRAVRSSTRCPAGVEEVFAVLSTERWAQQRDAALRDGSRVVRREETPEGGVTLAVSREIPAGAPSFLERFLPAEGRVTQVDVWGPPLDGRRSGTWSLEVPGAPASLGGVMRLEPDGDGSRYVVEGEVSVRIPLVGGRAESYLGGMVEKLAAKEGEVLRRAVS